MTKGDWLACAIAFAVMILMEVTARVLFGDWWMLAWTVMAIALYLLVIFLPERHYAWLVSRFPFLLRWSQPAPWPRPDVWRAEAERRALERLLNSSVAQPAPPNGKGTDV